MSQPSSPLTALPAVEGWFTEGEEPALIGAACTTCGTIVFPTTANSCPNPTCRGDAFEPRHLSRTGTVWSYSTNHYPPPPPYVAPDPFVPYTVLAVTLDEDALTVLGQLDGDPANLRVGDRVELTTGPLFHRDGVTHTIWKWRRVGGEAQA